MLTLLVVDDSRLSRKINTTCAREALGEQVNYLEAVSGEEALEMLADHAVDIMLLDLTMPGLSGYEVLKEIKNRGLDTRVVVISADVQRQTRERVTSLGAVGFIEKPLDPDLLHDFLLKLGSEYGV